jgi:hypothetical protein
MGGKSSKHKKRQRVTGFRRILDKYDSLEQVQAALREAGLESSNRTLSILFSPLFSKIREIATSLREKSQEYNM